ncbi:MAG: hypothetical protein B7X34_09935 [Acidobacteriia bacterium 12-62-4]|nr:MAG: hypothetical protein B7X34_09935 [Acidobacteriia bacterium 12-62-4]
MSQVNWPESFHPAKHRAYLDAAGKAVFTDIPKEVSEIAFIEPSEGADPFAARIERAKQLAAKGHVIDAQIDVWGWGAENTMRLRRLYGKTQVPDAFGTVQILVPPAK